MCWKCIFKSLSIGRYYSCATSNFVGSVDPKQIYFLLYDSKLHWTNWEIGHLVGGNSTNQLQSPQKHQPRYLQQCTCFTSCHSVYWNEIFFYLDLFCKFGNALTQLDRHRILHLTCRIMILNKQKSHIVKIWGKEIRICCFLFFIFFLTEILFSF